MNINNMYLVSFVKFIGINLCTCYCYFKIQNISKLNLMQKLFISILIFVFAALQSLLQPFTPKILRIFLIFFVFSIVLSRISNINFEKSLLVIIISQSLSYIFSYISIVLTLFFIKLITNLPNVPDIITITFNLCFNILLPYLFFKIRRFKNGFDFVKNLSSKSNLDIFILVVSTIIIFMYFFISYIRTFSVLYISTCFILLALILLFIIQRAISFYHKQKLQLQALKSYEQELSETKEKLAIAIEEKQKLIKSNHEFYHRQESLNKKLDDLMKQNKLSSNLNMNTEFAEDYSDILERINKLSDEYKAKTATIPNLEKTGITEIDDMLSYMQSECIKNNIEFNLKINCDVHYMIEKLISVSQLETLLGDLIRNSIIAINHSSKDFRSILVVFGMKDKIYELCVFDSGIPFEIDTLLNLGIKPASTHLDEGGSGIGFVTTFETMDSCNSSFVINEITNNNYTKSLEIKFDNLNEYIVVSDRKDEIAGKNAINKRNDIILK